MSDEFEELPFEKDERLPSPPSSEEKINIFFESTIGPSSKKEQLLVMQNSPVAEIKFTLSQMFGIEMENFHLISGGRTMDPDDTISNYDLNEGDIILLIPVSTAG